LLMLRGRPQCATSLLASCCCGRGCCSCEPTACSCCRSAAEGC
jgi:hypothetical protein